MFFSFVCVQYMKKSIFFFFFALKEGVFFPPPPPPPDFYRKFLCKILAAFLIIRTTMHTGKGSGHGEE